MKEPGCLSRRAVIQMSATALLGAAPAHVASASTAGQLETVNIVHSGGNFTLVMQYLLEQQGFLKRFGIDPVFTTVTDGSLIMGTLLSGTGDVCMYSGFGQVPVAVARGARLKLIAAASLRSFVCLFSKRPDIQHVSDLVGKNVGIGSPGSLLHLITLALLRKLNVDASKVTFVNVGSTTEIFRAVVAGVVDCGPGSIEVFDRQAQYGVHSLSDGEFWAELPEYTEQGSYTTDAVIANKRDALVRVLAGYATLYKFLQDEDSKATYLDASAKALGKHADMAGAAFQWNWFQKNKPFAQGLLLSESRLRFLEDINIEYGTMKDYVPFDKIADMSLAGDALRLVT